MAEYLDMEDENFLEIILSNLFRKESNGDAIDFFLRRTALDRQNNVEHDGKFKKLKEQIEKCGGHLKKEPSGCHSIELVFSEEITSIEEINSDLFKAEYIEECIKCGDLLDLEEFRLGKSPYDSININMIMKGHETWDSVSRNSHQRGKKLPDFGLPLQTSPETFKGNTHGKKSRVEYSVEEDFEILKFLLANNLYDKVGGNATWKIVHRAFPNHSYQSLHNRFRRFILPNLKKYKGLTNSERNLFNRISSNYSHTSSPEKTIETEIGGISSGSESQKYLSATENVGSLEKQEELNIDLPSIREKIAVNQSKGKVRINGLKGKNHILSSRMEKTLHLRTTEDIDRDENTPMTPNSLAMILGNLFRKESNGDPIEFYVRRTRFCQKNIVELEGKCSRLNEQIEKCGGNFGETPHSCYSIELVFPEVIDDIDAIDSDVFKAEYIEECIKCGDLLDLEAFRLGKSPYDGSVDINNIMKGYDSWNSVTRCTPTKGKKPPDFGSSPETVQSCSPGKKRRVEYSLEEDLAILKYLLYNNLYDKIEGKTTWKIVNREFPKYSPQSLQNRFHQFILPNLYNYRGLTKSERNLFNGSLNDTSSRVPSPKRNSVSQNESSTADEISESESSNLVSIPETRVAASSSSATRVIIEESSLSSNDDLETTKSSTIRKNGEKRAEDFTFKVDQSILQYIVLHKRYSEISGTKLWMDIQESLFQNTERDWKSIQRRFQNVIVKNLESKEYALDKDVIHKFHSNHLSSSSELDSDFDEATSYVKTQKSAPRLYTCEEDNLILNYIIREKRYEEVRGKKLWVDIQDKVLHEQNRSWESAKNRFLRTIFKNLHKFRLGADIIKKFERGAVVQRNLGGCHDRRQRSDVNRKKINIKEEESEEEVLPKHPALAMKKIPTPSKKQKRQLFRQPIIPLPIVFSPQPVPSIVNKKVESSKNKMKRCEKKKDSSTKDEILKSNEAVSNLETSPRKPVTEIVPALVTTSPTRPSSACGTEDLSNNICPLPKPLRSAPSIRCSVVVKKLTQDDLDKFGCKGSLTQKNSSSIHAEPILPVSIPPKTPSTTSRFTVEISPCLLAARLSAAGSFMPPISSAIPETVCSPVSPSQESTRNGKQLSTILKDVIDEVSSPETSTRISPEDSPLSTRSSTTIENCDVYDEINSEVNLVTEMDSSMPINAPNLPFQTKIPNQSFARLMKDDQSSDGYHTPEG